jgi:hypothetical protein
MEDQRVNEEAYDGYQKTNESQTGIEKSFRRVPHGYAKKQLRFC